MSEWQKVSLMATGPNRANGEPCCEKDYGGSHYHCGHCGEVTGMYGHFVIATYRDGTPFEGHTCAAGVRARYDMGDSRMYVEPVEAAS